MAYKKKIDKTSKTIGFFSWLFLVVSGLAWGLYIFGFNLVEQIDAFLGGSMIVAYAIFSIVGASGLYGIYFLSNNYQRMPWHANTAIILLIVGALNWVFYMFNADLVRLIFGESIFAKIVYGLVAASALYAIPIVSMFFNKRR